jgi:hypothetical protein
VTTRAEFAHFDARRENDMPLMHNSDAFVLVRTTCIHVINLLKKNTGIFQYNAERRGRGFK